jgi:cardiolipin synthase A/B
VLVFVTTEQVLLELIQSARESIYLVTFAAYKLPILVKALQDAAARSVRIAFILEDKKESGGKVTLSPFDALRVVGKRVATVYTWPVEMRARNDKGQHGSLHGKLVVTDGTRLFVSSANLTEFALNLNMEMGVLVSGGEVPRRAMANIEALIRDGVLRELPDRSC